MWESGINSINQMHPGNHRLVTKEHFHLVITSLYLLLLRYMGLLTKGTLANHLFFLHQTFSVLCRLPWAPSRPEREPPLCERFTYLEERLTKAAFWGCVHPSYPAANTGDVAPSQILSFSPLPAPNFELQKNMWVFWYHGSEFSSWIWCFCSALPFPIAKYVSTLSPHPLAPRW